MSPSADFSSDGFKLEFIDESKERHHRQHALLRINNNEFRVYLDSLYDGKIEFIEEYPSHGSKQIKKRVLSKLPDIKKEIDDYFGEIGYEFKKD